MFVYNSGATYLLSAILQRLTGEKLLDYLRPRLFEPLGASEATWQVSSEGITIGGWGLSLNTESLASLRATVAAARRVGGQATGPGRVVRGRDVEAGPQRQRGESRLASGLRLPVLARPAQHLPRRRRVRPVLPVFPEYDAALIVTSATFDMQAILDTVWDTCCPRSKARRSPGRCGPRNWSSAAERSRAARGDGRTYRFARNDAGLTAVRLDPEGTGTFTFAAVEDGSDETHELVCAAGDWREQPQSRRPPRRRSPSLANESSAVPTAR